MFLGCCVNANNGSYNVHAASKYDGPTDTTDEPPFLGHNRNGKWTESILFSLYFFLQSCSLLALLQSVSLVYIAMFIIRILPEIKR